MKYIFIISLIYLCSCIGSKRIISDKSISPANISLNGKLFSSVFQQRAAEYRALCLQGYNIARLRIDNYSAVSAKPKAIITDIDETILDNSPYAVHQAYKGTEYDAPSWYEWTDKSAADTMPGAASFLAYAASKQMEIFYITNRGERERAATLQNLKKFSLPYADEAHLLTRQTTSSKEARRQQVMQRYEVVLLMGDNLADFSSLFDKKTEAERKSNTDNSAGEFGKKFIIFPNVNYGDWEGSMYGYKYPLTQQQKDSVMKTVLKNY